MALSYQSSYQKFFHRKRNDLEARLALSDEFANSYLLQVGPDNESYKAMIAARNNYVLYKTGKTSTVLGSLTPYLPVCFDQSTRAIYGEHATAHHQLQCATPTYMKSMTLAEEKDLYAKFRMTGDKSHITRLHAYYMACGLDRLEDRLARLQKLYNTIYSTP